MKILFIDQNYDATNIGGAFKSQHAIINELMKNSEFEISVLATKSKKIEKQNFSAKPIRPVLKIPSKRINTLIKYFKINQYYSFFPILREIKKFKPDVIIVQRDLTFSSILAGFFKKVPIINIIRDAMGFCPKGVDTRGFKNCTSLLTKKECWECINRWRTLRIFLDDKPKGSDLTLITSLHTLYYKIQYFFTRLYLRLLKYTYVNIVASPLMKKLVVKRSKNIRVLIRKITPIDGSNIKISTKELNKNTLNKIENSNKIILFVIPRNEGGSKGYPFVKRLLNMFPDDYLIIIVGTLINELKNYRNRNVINIDKVPTDNLYFLYQKANITIVPSIYTEAFGRVVIESIINKTPIMISPQTSAKFLFENKNYVKILPLKLNLWVEEIKNFLYNPVSIPDEDVRKIEREFSAEKCAKEIIEILKLIKCTNTNVKN